MTSRILTHKSRSPRNSRWPPIPFPLWLLDHGPCGDHAHLANSELANLQARDFSPACEARRNLWRRRGGRVQVRLSESELRRLRIFGNCWRQRLPQDRERALGKKSVATVNRSSGPWQ